MECFQKAAEMKNVQIDLMSWMQSWLMTSGINTLTPVVQKTENGKYSISIKQDKAKTGDVEVLREQMIDVAVFKKTKVAGVS